MSDLKIMKALSLKCDELQSRIKELEGRIEVALRLNKHGMIGFVPDALRGKDLSYVKVYGGTLEEFCDACDREVKYIKGERQ